MRERLPGNYPPLAQAVGKVRPSSCSTTGKGVEKMDRRRLLKQLTYPVLVAFMLAGCDKAIAPPTRPPQTVTQQSQQPSETKTLPQPQAKDPKQMLNQGNELLLKGDAAGAAEILVRLVGEFPDHAVAWDLLGLAYARMGNFKVAHLVGERAVALAPTDPAALFNAGVASARASNLQRAAVHLEEASKLNQTQADPLYMLAKVYEASYQKDKARSAYQEAVKRFPMDSDLKRAKAAFEADLTMDGKGERVTVSQKTVTVADGSTGAILGTTADWQFAVTGDIGGEAPVLMTVNHTYVVVYTIVKGGLVEAGRFSSASAVYSQVDQAVVVKAVNSQKRQVTYHRMQDGKLVVAKQFTYPSNPFLPPTSLVELFAGVATMNPAAFQDQNVTQDLLDHLGVVTPARIQAPFLLANADGTYRIEIFQEGKVTEKAKAEVKEYKVTALQWDSE